LGFKFRDYMTFKPAAQFGFGGALKALGLQKTAEALVGRKLTRDQAQGLMDQLTERTRGHDVVILVTDQEGSQGRKFSGVDAYHPAEEWQTLQTIGVSSANGQQQPPSGGTITDLDVPFCGPRRGGCGGAFGPGPGGLPGGG